MDFPTPPLPLRIITICLTFNSGEAESADGEVIKPNCVVLQKKFALAARIFTSKLFAGAFFFFFFLKSQIFQTKKKKNNNEKNYYYHAFLVSSKKQN